MGSRMIPDAFSRRAFLAGAVMSRLLALPIGRLADADAAGIRGYLDSLASRGFASTSQARRLSALRQFFRFLYAEGLRGDDPTGIVDSPKKDRALPKTMSEGETGRLLDRAASEAADPDAAGTDTLSATRIHALVEVLYATGLRVSELVSLPLTVALRDEIFVRIIELASGEKPRPP